MEKGKSLVGVLALVLLGGAFPPYPLEGAAMTNPQTDQNSTGQKKSEPKPVFACNMLALNAEERRRHKTVSDQMRAATKEIRPLADGYAFRFTAEQSTILLASEFVARERLCCPFFTFELVAEPEDGPLWLRLRGPDGVKDFIKAEFSLK